MIILVIVIVRVDFYEPQGYLFITNLMRTLNLGQMDFSEYIICDCINM